MSLPSECLRRIKVFFHRREFHRDLEEELRLHLDLRRQQQIDAGLPPEAAGRAAKLQFGNTTRIHEESYMRWGWEWLESFLSDILYGIRSMLRSPSLSAVALVSLALGIGANTAIFSLLDAVMLRSLPVRDPAQLVLLGNAAWQGISDGFAITELYSYPFYRQLQRRNQVFSDTAAVFSMTNEVHGFVNGRVDSEPMNVQLVSGTYFPTLGVQATIGRSLNDGDDNSEGDHPVAVISYGWWKRILGSDPAVLGKQIKLGATTFQIVGVAPPEFFGTKVGEVPDLWVPLSMAHAVPPGWGDYKGNLYASLYIIGRLKSGVSVDQATTNVNLLYQQILRGFPDAKLTQQNLQNLARAHVPLTTLATGISSIRSQFSQSLLFLMVVVALVLLIACANIANLLLARSTVRARELAVRQALGASRTRIARQLLTESLLLAVLGGAIGIVLASVASRMLLKMVSGGLETIPLDVSVDARLLSFTVVLTVGTALLFGTLPAFRATRLQLTDSLKDGRGPAVGGTRSILARALVVSQVALSLVLTVGAGIFLRNLIHLTQIDTGFNKENVLRLQIDASSVGYKEDEPRLPALYRQIEERVSALPGVRAASFSSFTFHEGSWNTSVIVAGMPVDPDVDVKHNVVGPGYFSTMQIPLLAGRPFGRQDTATSQRVAIISEHMAKALFPKGSPLGRSYHIGDRNSPFEEQVIGIARDVKFEDLRESPDTLDYIPYTQRNQFLSDFEVRYTGDFAAIAAAVQQSIHSVDRTLPITDVTTLDEQVARSITNQRLVAQLSVLFGLLALFLSCIGIYGLMSYIVSRRTNEIGIRMALGAARSNVQWLVMREVVLLVALGIGMGIPLTLGGSRLVASMLYGANGTDLTSLLAAVWLLVAVAFGAGYFPAKRASNVDPMVALRYE